MNTEPFVGLPEPSAPAQSLADHHGHINSGADAARSITLSIAMDDFDLTNHLVVTFAKNGSLECPEMLLEDSISRLLYDIELKGQNVVEPSLMAIAGDDGLARRVFITPCPAPNFRDYAVWVGLVSETIQNLKARDVALYPCHGSLTDENTFELIAQLVRALIDSKSTENVAFIVGRYNYNKVLNLLLELKNELKTDAITIKVVH